MIIPVQIIVGFFSLLILISLGIFSYINHLTGRVGKLEGKLEVTDFKQLETKYTNLREFLGKVKESDEQIKNANLLLNLLADKDNKQANKILTNLNKIEEKQKSQPIIKFGRIGIKDDQGFIQTERLQKASGNRYEPIDVKFDVNFSERPDDVFVALSMVDGECDINSRSYTVRVHVYAESITKEGFTLVTKTWEGSKIHNIDAIWIAIGK